MAAHAGRPLRALPKDLAYIPVAVARVKLADDCETLAAGHLARSPEYPQHTPADLGAQTQLLGNPRNLLMVDDHAVPQLTGES